MQIKIDLYVGDIDNVELQQLITDANAEGIHRGLKMPKPSIKIMADAEFTTHLSEVLSEAKQRAIPLPGTPLPSANQRSPVYAYQLARRRSTFCWSRR